MKELMINKGMFFLRSIVQARKEHHLMGALLLLWVIVTLFFSSPEMSGGINQSIPLMVVLSMITYLLLLDISWWLFSRFWIRAFGMPVHEIVLKFKDLEEWQQISLLWASFALLLLAGLACLTTII